MTEMILMLIKAFFIGGLLCAIETCGVWIWR